MDSENLLSKFDEMAKQISQIIQEERAKMKAEFEACNAEKQTMKAVETGDDYIIHLNVGGQKMTTKRSTLCQVEGSLLASMFSGRWEDRLPRDQHGCVFFDFNSQYFSYILDYLRAKKIATPKNPAPLPNVPDDQLMNFKNLVEYLGLSDEIVPREILPSDIFTSHSAGIYLDEDRKVAVHDADRGHKYVLGTNVYKEGIVRFKLKSESFENNNWLLVGIVKADVVPKNDDSYKWPGSYGWALGDYGQVWKDGSYTIDTTLQKLTLQGDTVELVVDCDSAKLSLYVPSGHKFHIEIPKSEDWRLSVNLHGAHDKIRMVNA